MQIWESLKAILKAIILTTCFKWNPSPSFLVLCLFLEQKQSKGGREKDPSDVFCRIICFLEKAKKKKKTCQVLNAAIRCWPKKRCLSKYRAHGVKSDILHSWGQHMCEVFEWFSSIDCWLDDWARTLRHLTMLMVFRTNIHPLETRIWSGWSNAAPVSQLFMIWDPSAIHHSWFWHHLIIQNNQLHLCKLALT